MGGGVNASVPLIRAPRSHRGPAFRLSEGERPLEEERIERGFGRSIRTGHHTVPNDDGVGSAADKGAPAGHARQPSEFVRASFERVDRLNGRYLEIVQGVLRATVSAAGQARRAA
jgi:hypothetical protein